MIMNLLLLALSTCSPSFARWDIRLFHDSAGSNIGFCSESALSLSEDSRLNGFPSSETCIICFNVSTTWLIFGRSFALFNKQLSANLAILLAALEEYWFSSRGSITCPNLLLSGGNCFTHSRSFCSVLGRFLSNDRLPVKISYNTTPKLQTSLLAVR
ncbi:LOW QUALITY PROTEIN: hypothetical protein TorRG33x02_045540 [Trema orientale]|uniref:Secreted protein n=1 Tax=Trema orientale TaxID=63057 RepID=A0A2P5FPR7_TREOI|nr:LOW QUALITY PROTEIN: hypothetical protein TorRG33x02_045540 [Trema orientale]